MNKHTIFWIIALIFLFVIMKSIQNRDKEATQLLINCMEDGTSKKDCIEELSYMFDPN